MVERSRVSLPPAVAMNVIVPEPSLSFTCTENDVVCSRPSEIRRVCGRRFLNLDVLRTLGPDLHLRIFAGTLDVVRNGYADLEVVAGRGQDRHARRDHKRSANQCVALRRAGRVIGHRHSHYRERAAEIIRHVVDDFACRWVGVHDTRPIDHRLFGDPLEGIQLLPIVAVTAERGHRAQNGKFRHDQVHDLRGFDAEGALAEEEAERIGQLVIAHLQDALIDREDRDPGGPVGLIADMKRLAWFRDCGGLQIHFEPALLDVRRERDHPIAERAGKDFFRIERANQRDVDVAAPLEAIRHSDSLDAAGRIGLEPPERVNFVALDRDQAAPRVGRGDADFDLLAAVVLRAREFHLQLRILVHRAFHDPTADDGKTNPADLASSIIAELDDVIPGLIRR